MCPMCPRFPWPPKRLPHSDPFSELSSALHDFADKLVRAAELHLEPGLNDGVVLNEKGFVKGRLVVNSIK